MTSPRTTALSLLSSRRTPSDTPTGPQLRLAQEVSLLGALRGSLGEAERQGDTQALARLAPLVATRSEKVSTILEQSEPKAASLMTGEERRARIRELVEKATWLREPAG